MRCRAEWRDQGRSNRGRRERALDCSKRLRVTARRSPSGSSNPTRDRREPAPGRQRARQRRSCRSPRSTGPSRRQRYPTAFSTSPAMSRPIGRFATSRFPDRKRGPSGIISPVTNPSGRLRVKPEPSEIARSCRLEGRQHPQIDARIDSKMEKFERSTYARGTARQLRSSSVWGKRRSLVISSVAMMRATGKLIGRTIRCGGHQNEAADFMDALANARDRLPGYGIVWSELSDDAIE